MIRLRVGPAASLFREGLTFEADGDHPVVVLSGLNAVGKSIIARTFHALASGNGAEAARLWSRGCQAEGQAAELRWGDSRAELVCRGRGGECEVSIEGSVGALSTVVEDSRVVLRKYVLLREQIWEGIESAEDLMSRLPEQINRFKESGQTEAASALHEALLKLQSLVELLKHLDAEIANTMYSMKRLKESASTTHLQRELSNMYWELVERAAKALQEELGDYKLELTAFDLHPLAVEATVPPERGGAEVEAQAYDLRFNKFVPTPVLSSSVASFATITQVLHFLSIPPGAAPRRRLLVVEEPEEALAPPQQVVLVKALGQLLKHVRERYGVEVYMVVTTHSPYIAYALKEFSRSYFVCREGSVFTAREDIPYTVFAMAHVLGTGAL